MKNLAAKFLQAVGWLLLYWGEGSNNTLILPADILLLAGCAYEAWAVRILTGHSVRPRIHILTTFAIILACLISVFMVTPIRESYIFILISIFYFLPGLFLFVKSSGKLSLRMILGVCYFVTGTVYLAGSAMCYISPENFLSLVKSVVLDLVPVVSFCIFLVSGFIMLMLAKEKSDMLVQEMQKNLKKSEIRFQKIVETAIEGILIFDENYRITFANKNKALIEYAEV